MNITPQNSFHLSRQASCDEQLIRMWLHSKAATTQKAYGREIELFCKFVQKPLQLVTIAEVQDYVDVIRLNRASATVARSLNAVKSLMSFGQSVGYLSFNAAAPEHAPKVKNTTAERILSQEEVQCLIAAEQCSRNRIILLMLYTGGLRVSELCSLKWRDLKDSKSNGQVTVFGKGGKTRIVLIPKNVWEQVKILKGSCSNNDDFVFQSRKGGNLTSGQVWRIVKAAAKNAGIIEEVSPHWLRHCSASHALDAGAPLHLVQKTLGHSSAATTSKYLHARPDDSAGMYLGF